MRKAAEAGLSGGRSALRGAVLLLLLLPAGGCAPAGAMAAAQLVSGLVAGGAPEKAIQPGTGVQNGHYQDESIPQALAASRRESLPACRSRLPADQPEISPGQCGYSHVCLPGAASPTELYVCMPEEEPDMTKAAAAVAAPQAAEAP